MLHHMRFRALLVIAVFSFLIAAGTGCGREKKIGDEPTKYRSQEGLAKLSSAASRNQAFPGAKAVTPNDTACRYIDSIVRPVLAKKFGGAKLIAVSTAPETRKDGEVIENQLTYIVKDMMTRDSGKAVHADFLAAHFGTSPRLGTKPTSTKTWVMMSFLKSATGRHYSLVVKIDLATQMITVDSYKPGSKYDRLL